MSDYLTVSISVDALEWTDHWLQEGQRCDLLSVSIACSERVTPKVRIIAVESKARSEVDPFPLSLEAEPFKKGVPQVVSTLEALHEILCPGEIPDVMSDLKQGAFIEHLLSEILSRIYPVPRDLASNYTHVIKYLTLLSRRELACGSELLLSGMVVATQRKTTAVTVREAMSIQGEEHAWRIELIRCGVPHLRRLFEELGLPGISAATTGGSSPTVTPESANEHTPVGAGVTGDISANTGVSGEGGQAAGRQRRDQNYGRALGRSGLRTGATAEGAIAESAEDESGSEQQSQMAPDLQELSPDVIDLVAQLQSALNLRQFPTEPIELGLTVVGPTLVSVPVVLRAGQSSRAIEAATKDIARELGVRSVSVENDTRAYHIRFLIPRRDRTFPQIPPGAAISYDVDRNQYLGLLLGVGVDGMPYRSFVSEWPHLLVAGTTGSGKTTFLKSVLVELASLPVGSFEIVIVDGKAEYDYVGLVPTAVFSSKFPDVMLGHENAPDVLRWLVEEEIPRRREVLRKFFSENPTAPRQPREALVKAWSSNNSFPIKPIIIFIDEFAEIMQASGSTAREFEGLVQRAVQTGRSALVHLMLATQRPDASVIAGAIKANLPSRVALALPSHHDSMTILNAPGAEDLVGSGDMLFLSSAGGVARLQAYNPIVPGT